MIFKLLWSLFFLFIINYNFIKRALPFLKNIFIAVTGVFPIGIIDFYQGADFIGMEYYALVLIGIFGRELAFDIPDTAGDGRTIANFLGKSLALRTVILVYIAFLALYLSLIDSAASLMTFIFSLVMLVIYGYLRWCRSLSEKSLASITGLSVGTPLIYFIR